MNLLEETNKILTKNYKSWTDVRWIGSKDFYIPIDRFIEIAKFTNYDAGYGAPKIATDLVVVGDNFWLERHEYDGVEWWEYKELPIKPNVGSDIDTLQTRDIGYKTLMELQMEEEEEDYDPLF